MLTQSAMSLQYLSIALLLLVSPVFAQKPNVVVIISDDAGYADWEFMDDYLQTLNPGQAASPVPTPNLNALRGRGTLLTSAYTAAVCSPSRAAIVTGSYQQRVGYEYNINNFMGATAIDGLSPDTPTIFDRMGAEGYTTGVIGKWHIGARANDNGLGNRPENQGVDEFFGIWKGSRNYTIGSTTGSGELRETITSPFSDTVLETTAPWNTTNNYVTNAFGIGAVDFIDRHYDDPDPFFLYVAFTAPHGPIGPSPDIDDPRLAGLTDNRKDYASMVLTMDKEIGNILNKLDDPAGDGSISLTDNTLVIFINDNGGANGIGTVNTPLKNFKGSVYEGGTRVPMIIAGPGLPENDTYHEPIHSIDILPTCLEAAGAIPPADIDGVSLIPHLKGTTTEPPHEVLTIRSESKVGVRKGKWKLTSNSTSAPFSLFDLSSDIGESTDLANTNPEIVEELLNDFTAFEVGADKPRHAGLNKSPGSINLNDRFILNPQPIDLGPFTSNLTLIGGALLNGDFNAGGGSGAQTFDQTPTWQNIGTGAGSLNATQTSLDANGTRNAIIAESATREFGLETNHSLATGEIFQATYQWRDASNWNDPGDKIRVSLFTTSDDNLSGTPTILASLDSELSSLDNSYQTEIALFPPIPASANGKKLFISLNSAQTGSGFARLDDFTLDRGTIGGGGGGDLPVALNWSTQNAWTDPDTASQDTLLSLDAFAGCVLEFPTTDNFSYTASNNMMRPTGLTFMLNSLKMTGEFIGANPQSATINGNELLFSNDLSGMPPSFSLGSNGPAFGYEISNPFILYHDLTIDGDGTAAFTLNGEISEYLNPVNLTKTGTSHLHLTTSPTYTGTTSITEGQLTIGDQVNLSTSSRVVIGPDGTLGGNGSIGAEIVGSGTISPGQSTGALTATNDAKIGALLIEVDGPSNDRFDVTGSLDITGATLTLADLGGGLTEPIYTIASYGSLTGTFTTINNFPAGYSIDYAFEGSRIVLISDTDPFTTWSQTTHGLTGEDAGFDTDPDKDGLPNSIEFVLGTNPATPDQTPPLLFELSNGNTLASFPLAARASYLSPRPQFSDDLETWQDQIAGVDGNLTIEENFFAPSLHKVTIEFAGVVTAHHFFRLQVNR